MQQNSPSKRHNQTLAQSVTTHNQSQQILSNSPKKSMSPSKTQAELGLQKQQTQKFKQLLMYKNLNKQGTMNKENNDQTEKLSPILKKSPSKMNDQEKMIYRDYLFREGDKISEYLTEQINKCENVRSMMREQMKENAKVIEHYDREQENFSISMENKIKQFCSNSLINRQSSLRGYHKQKLYMNRSMQRDNQCDNPHDQSSTFGQPLEVLEISDSDISFVQSNRASGKKMIRITNKEIRHIKNPYYKALQDRDINKQEQIENEVTEDNIENQNSKEDKNISSFQDYKNYVKNLAAVNSKVKVWNLRQYQQLPSNNSTIKNNLQQYEKENNIPIDVIDEEPAIESGMCEIKLFQRHNDSGNQAKNVANQNQFGSIRLPQFRTSRARNNLSQTRQTEPMKTINEQCQNEQLTNEIQKKKDLMTYRKFSAQRPSINKNQNDHQIKVFSDTQQKRVNSTTLQSYQKQNNPQTFLKLRNSSISNINIAPSTNIPHSQTPTLYPSISAQSSRQNLRGNYESILRPQTDKNNPSIPSFMRVKPPLSSHSVQSSYLQSQVQSEQQQKYQHQINHQTLSQNSLNISNTNTQHLSQQSGSFLSTRLKNQKLGQNNYINQAQTIITENHHPLYMNENQTTNKTLQATNSKEELISQHKQMNEELVINLNKRLLSNKISNNGSGVNSGVNSFRKMWRI